MCDELGDQKYMEEYVMEAGGVSPCALDGEGCSEKEKKYLEKWKAKSLDDCRAQLKRLEGFVTGKMKPELMQWIKQRLGILRQIVEVDTAEGDEKPVHEEL